MNNNNKNLLQEYFQGRKVKVPIYKSENRGADHSKEFRANITINGIEVYSDWCKTKKSSEDQCAFKCLQFIKDNNIEIKNELDRMDTNDSSTSSQKQQQQASPPKQQQPKQQTNITDPNLPKKRSDIIKEEIKRLQIELEKVLKEELLYTNDGLLDREVLELPVIRENRKDTTTGTDSNNTTTSKSNKSNKEDDDYGNINYGLKNKHQLPSGLKTKPREYQIELFNKAMEGNIICCLPTGLGKTLISCMVIKRMKELNLRKRIIFMVDRIPLVIQQAKVIQEETGLSVFAAYGESFKLSLLQQSSFDVLVIIGALLTNLLNSKDLNLNLFSLIVIDEAHHIVNNHPFAVLLKSKLPLLSQENQPKLLGLTASPAGKKDFLSTLLSLKLITKVSGCSIIKPDDQTLQQYNNSKNVTIIPIQTNNFEQYSIKLLNNIISLFKLNLISDDENLFDICSSIIEVDKQSQAQAEQTLMQAVSVSNINNNISKFLSSFLEKLNDYMSFNFIDEFGKSLQGLNLKQFFINEINLNINDQSTRQRILDLLYFIPDDELIDPNQSKLEYALSILNEFHQQSSSSSTTGTASDPMKCIIFVKTRKSANTLFKIFEIINKSDQFSFIKPCLVIGHGGGGGVGRGEQVANNNGNGNGNGMTITEQKLALENFRNDITNLIIATSVAEEGLDIASMNLVIRLDPPTTVTANIQSRGRLRHKNSFFYGIVKVDNPNETSIYDQFVKQEKHLQDSIEFLKTGILPFKTSIITKKNLNLIKSPSTTTTCSISDDFDKMVIDGDSDNDTDNEGDDDGLGIDNEGDDDDDDSSNFNDFILTNEGYTNKVDGTLNKIKALGFNITLEWEYIKKNLPTTAVATTIDHIFIAIGTVRIDNVITHQFKKKARSKRLAKEKTSKFILSSSSLYKIIREL